MDVLIRGRSAAQSSAQVSAAPRIFRTRLVLAMLAAAFVATFLLSLLLGSVMIPIGDLLAILTGGEPARETWRTIVLNFRLPKAITAVLAGAGLSMSGLIMQTLFRNPLADPFILGISSGASLGVGLVVLIGGSVGTVLLAGIGLVGDAALVTAASLGAGSVLMLVLLVSRRLAGVTSLLILGLMFGYVTSALVSMMIHFSAAERIQTYINWTFGSFGGVTWGQMGLFAGTVIFGGILSMLASKPLNALLLGEQYARTMGVDVQRARRLLILSAAVIAGAVTTFCGPIGFIGVAVPHLCRGLLKSADHRLLLPSCALLGGTLALAADMIAQFPGSQIVLPLNAITALLGAPVVIAIILRRRAEREIFLP